MRISDWSSDVCSSDLEAGCDRGQPLHVADPRSCDLLGCIGRYGDGDRQCALRPARGGHDDIAALACVYVRCGGIAGCTGCVARRGLMHLILGKCRRGQRAEQDRRTDTDTRERSEEHTSELQPLMRLSYAVFRLKKTKYSCLTSPISSRHTS